MKNKLISVSLPTIKRLPTYLNVLEELKVEGKTTVSATDIAKRLSLIPIQVRKDLSATGIVGKPKIGFEIEELGKAIKALLGWENDRDAFLIGAGALGSALLGYNGFEQHGLKILAAFDSNPDICDTEIHGKRVFPMEKLRDLIERMKVSIIILTLPAEFAQEVVNKLIGTGIKGIWNFSPVTLDVPKEIIVQNENLASGLAVLSTKLTERNNG